MRHSPELFSMSHLGRLGDARVHESILRSIDSDAKERLIAATRRRAAKGSMVAEIRWLDG
jgi:hypothetical protein